MSSSACYQSQSTWQTFLWVNEASVIAIVRRKNYDKATTSVLQLWLRSCGAIIHRFQCNFIIIIKGLPLLQTLCDLLGASTWAEGKQFVFNKSDNIITRVLQMPFKQMSLD